MWSSCLVFSIAAPVCWLSGPAGGSGSLRPAVSGQPVSGGSSVPAIPCSVSLSAAQHLLEQIHQDRIQGGVQVLHELSQVQFFSRLRRGCHILKILFFYRYYVKMSGLEDKLPHHYPISQPAQSLLSQLLSLVLQKPWALLPVCICLYLSVPLRLNFLFLHC